MNYNPNRWLHMDAQGNSGWWSQTGFMYFKRNDTSVQSRKAEGESEAEGFWLAGILPASAIHRFREHWCGLDSASPQALTSSSGLSYKYIATCTCEGAHVVRIERCEGILTFGTQDAYTQGLRGSQTLPGNPDFSAFSMFPFGSFTSAERPSYSPGIEQILIVTVH